MVAVPGPPIATAGSAALPVAHRSDPVVWGQKLIRVTVPGTAAWGSLPAGIGWTAQTVCSDAAMPHDAAPTWTLFLTVFVAGSIWTTTSSPFIATQR